jgi:hypothetical protein
MRRREGESNQGERGYSEIQRLTHESETPSTPIPMMIISATGQNRKKLTASTCFPLYTPLATVVRTSPKANAIFHSITPAS